MTAKKKTAVAALALAGAVLVSGLSATGAMAGMGGDNDRGARLSENFALIDADKDGKVTVEELTAYRAAEFAAADTDKDGKLSAEELNAREIARFTATVAERTARILGREDANADGSLSADEIDEGPLAGKFAQIDTDNDGAITEAEINAAVSQHGEGRGDRKHGDKGGWFN